MPGISDTVLITGASRGLGRAAALTFAKAGAAPVLCGRSEEELSAVAREIKDLDGQCLYYSVDVQDFENLDKIAASAADILGPATVLVNNAAVIGPPEFLDNDTSPDWSETLDINLKGPVNSTKAVLPYMMEQGKGTVINLVSGLAWMSFPRFSAYCASKAGLYQLTRCLAEEYRDSNLVFYAVDPGIMDTPMQSGIRSLGKNKLGPLWQQFQNMKASGQLMDPFQVADLLLALAINRPREKNGNPVAMRDLGAIKP